MARAANTGSLLIGLLERHGVEVIFGAAGGQICALIDAAAGPRAVRLGDRPGAAPRYLLMRDERSTAFAADAYARLTGKIGVCCVTVGPGTTKLPSGLMESYNASVPLLCIISDVNRDWYPLMHRGAATQAMDQEAMLRPLCKAIARLNAPEQLPEMLGALLNRATSGRPGPVALIIPHDVFDQATNLDAASARVNGQWGRFPQGVGAPDPEAVRRAVAALAAAERPVMIAGGGVLLSRAWDAARELAEALTLPVATTFTGRGALPDAHPLSAGLLGAIGTSAARTLVDEADLLLLVGYKSAQNSTFSWQVPRADQRIIHLDVDPAEVGKVFAVEVGLVGDARLGLEALRDALPSRSPRADRLERVRTLVQAWRDEHAGQLASDATPILPQRVMGELAALARPDDLVICDASYVTGWGMLHFPITRSGFTVMAPRGSAGLGYSLPAAIGAAAACPDRRVIVLAGDGGIAYALGEWATLALHDLKVTTLILNNSSLAWIDHWHRIYFEADGAPFRWNDVHFAKVAEGFGLLARRVTEPAEVGPALRAALESPASAVVELITSQEETPIPSYEDAMARAGRVTSYAGGQVAAD